MKRIARALITLTGCAVLAGMPGCYKKVVSKKGLTVDAHHPRKAKSSETNIDKAIDNLFQERNN